MFTDLILGVTVHALYKIALFTYITNTPIVS